MKKIYQIAVVLALFLGLITAVHADGENLDLTSATVAETQKCDFSNGPLMGQAWSECEQYIYEMTNLATAATTTDTQVGALQLQIVDLLNQISILNQ